MSSTLLNRILQESELSKMTTKRVGVRGQGYQEPGVVARRVRIKTKC